MGGIKKHFLIVKRQKDPDHPFPQKYKDEGGNIGILP